MTKTQIENPKAKNNLFKRVKIACLAFKDELFPAKQIEAEIPNYDDAMKGMLTNAVITLNAIDNIIKQTKYTRVERKQFIVDIVKHGTVRTDVFKELQKDKTCIQTVNNIIERCRKEGVTKYEQLQATKRAKRAAGTVSTKRADALSATGSNDRSSTGKAS